MAQDHFQGTVKGRHLLRALERIGWQIKSKKATHFLLIRQNWQPYCFHFYQQEVGAKMLNKISRQTGLRPSDI